MVCNIQAHMEIKVNGKWEYYNELHIDRNYCLFGKMAGVRDEDEEPLADKRGFPEDASFMTKLKRKYWVKDGHSDSWLTSKELAALEKWIEENRIILVYRPIVFLFGSSFCDWFDYPEDNKRVQELGVEDFRWVFWFDG